MKSGFLADAVVGYLDRLKCERDFDATFIALLRNQGFFDIHCIHGAFEFGKDFIAKRSEKGQLLQYAFQSKLGDVGKSEWQQDIRPQCDTMADNELGHPQFDTSLPRRDVVIFTGNFKKGSQAAILAQQYAQSRSKRSYHSVEYWTRSTIVDLLCTTDGLAVYADLQGLFGYLDSADKGVIRVDETESWTSRWANFKDPGDLWRAFLEASLLQQLLNTKNLGFHRTAVSYGLTRAVAVAGVTKLATADVSTASALCLKTLRDEADRILKWFNAIPPEYRDRALPGVEPFSILSLGPKLFRWLELISLWTLTINPGDSNRETARQFLRFVTGLGCVQRPLSDRYAVSILSTALALDAAGEEVIPWLQAIVVWLCERYEGGELGIAGPRSSTEDELWRTVGVAYDHPDVKPRKDSVLAAAILDACSILGLKQLYDDAMNDFLAVSLVPTRLIPDEAPGEFFTGTSGCVTSPGDYSENWIGKGGWRNSTMHKQAAIPRWFDDNDATWIGLALSFLLRDRWWLFSLIECHRTAKEEWASQRPSA